MQSDFSKRPTRRALLGGAAATLALPGLLRAGTRAVETLTGPAFGTSWQVTLPAGRGIETLRGPIMELLAGIDTQMSPWRADSDITRFNAAGPGACTLPRRDGGGDPRGAGSGRAERRAFRPHGRSAGRPLGLRPDRR